MSINYYMYEVQSKDFIKNINNKTVEELKGCMINSLKEIAVNNLLLLLFLVIYDKYMPKNERQMS